MALIAAKTLSRVEVDPDASNQHELHAGRLRRLLGFEEPRVEGTLTFVYYRDSESPPEIDEDLYTLLDVRRDRPGRREFHLYYYSKRFQSAAAPGDLLVMLRPDPDSPNLFGIVARGGSDVERDLRHALALGPTAIISRFLRPSPPKPSKQEAEQLAMEMAAPAARRLQNHPLFIQTVRQRRLPSAAQMAAAAHEIVQDLIGPSADPDLFLMAALEAETDLFFAMEQAIGDAQLTELLERGGGFEEVLSFAMSKLQARRSRRGLSLQNHMQALFERHRIPYTPQCETEAGAVPDFIIPSCEAYHDSAFPSERLRMVGCKSRLRERWPQYLREAVRINPKYHVSLDEGLTEDLIRRMHEAGLRLFMPNLLKEERYKARATAPLLGTITELLADLSKTVWT